MPYSTNQQKLFNNKCRRFAKKLQCIRYLGGKCIDCGCDNIHFLQFHHLNPEKKEFQISSTMKRSWKLLKKELDKCALVCSNCHRARHSDVTFFNENKEQIEKLLETGMFVEVKISDSELLELIRNGYSQHKISKLYKMARTTVQHRIRQLLKKGLLNSTETTVAIKRDSNKRQETKVTNEMILPLLNSGESINKISKKFNVRFTTVQRKAKKLCTSGLWIPTESQVKYIQAANTATQTKINKFKL